MSYLAVNTDKACLLSKSKITIVMFSRIMKTTMMASYRARAWYQQGDLLPDYMLWLKLPSFLNQLRTL